MHALGLELRTNILKNWERVNQKLESVEELMIGEEISNPNKQI